MSDRLNSLQSFADEALRARGETLSAPLRTIAGDASFRRFFRAQTAQHTYVAVDAPPATENNAQYLALSQRWRAHHIPVPEVLAHDLAHGFFLVSHVGQRQFADVVAEPDTHVRPLYEQALRLLTRIQRLPNDGSCPPYEAARLRMELSLFPEWLVDKLLSRTLRPAEKRLYTNAGDVMIECLTAQHALTVHRDFHSRNLLIDDAEQLALVDYQDALWGPYVYDVVSLLRDCYVRWPDAVVEELRRFYLRLASDFLPREATAEFGRDFDLTGVQRHLKAMGIFARLHVRDDKHHYLKDIPRVFGYVLDVARTHPELARLADWLGSEIEPAYTRWLAQRPR